MPITFPRLKPATTRMLAARSSAFLFLLTQACASLSSSGDFSLNDELELKPSLTFKHYVFKTKLSVASTEASPAKPVGSTGKSEDPGLVTWSVCHQSQSQSAFLVVVDIDALPPDHRDLCLKPLAQAFIHAKVTPVIISANSLTQDYQGDWVKQGKRALGAVLASYAAKSGNGAGKIGFYPIKGAWVAGATSIMIGDAVRKGEFNVDALAFEQGWYDLQQTKEKSQDPVVRTALAALESSRPGALDDDSLAYDFEDLPKKITLCHGVDNASVPYGQAEEFADSLQSSQFSSTLVKLPGVGAVLNPTTRYQLIKKMLATGAGH